jgi:hypothetical protein
MRTTIRLGIKNLYGRSMRFAAGADRAISQNLWDFEKVTTACYISGGN